MKEQSGEQKHTSIFNTEGGKSEPKTIKQPSISLPKGGGAIKGIDEKFSVNAVNGTAGLSLPLPVSPARGLTPSLAISYNSGNGNDVFGLGWGLGLPSIKRRTSKELPQYLDASESDIFQLAGAEDLVPEFQKEPDGTFSKDAAGNYIFREHDSADGKFVIRNYIPRVEALFARIERWTHKTTLETRWRVTTSENKTTLLGWSDASRIADPNDPRRVYEWLPEFIYDDAGNCNHYIYKPEDDAGFDATLPHNNNRRPSGKLAYTNRYLSQIFYGNKTPYQNFGDPFPAASDFMFEIALDYGEYDLSAPYQQIQPWTQRPDAFSNYKPGFEIRTTRLCQRVLLWHHFAQLPGGSALIRSLDLGYDTSAEQGFTFLVSATMTGYIKQNGGTYTQKQMPPTEFSYQKHAWNQQVENIASEDVVHAPADLTSGYTFTDLYGEGLAGILTEQADGWYYKRNLGGGKFERAQAVSPRPAMQGLGKSLQLLDLGADGNKQLVSLSSQPKGYFELDDDNDWQNFTPFVDTPNVDLKDPDTRLIDLTGDGKPDLLITEDEVFTWYESEGRMGYAAGRKVAKPFDEEAGPSIVFADPKQMIFLADMSGDGLVDIVRIRAADVCYWPNMGYGKFGAKVAMDSPPVFDAPDAFNPAFIHLADIDGSGTTDIIYLGKNRFTCWLNLSGNAFAAKPFEISSFPEIHSQADVSIVDLLGTGTMCIVWSSPLEKDAGAPLRYIDLMSSKKPHLLINYRNNFGKEVNLQYTPSTAFYLADELAGQPWITKLHFPVQCISSSETLDHISEHRFVSSYTYHHGYYDHPEREFRGFGRVEQIDAEDFDHWVLGGSSNVVEQDLHQEPVITKKWFHTGAFLRRDKILTQFADEYWYAEMARLGYAVTNVERALPEAQLIAAPNLDPSLIDHLTGEERQEALRSCKSMPLRSEIFAHDAPATGATPQQLQAQLTPYAVENSNCTIELLQPKGQNQYSVFTVKESENIAYHYERDTADPRIAHTLNIAFDEYGNILESANVVYGRKVADVSLPADIQTVQARTLITYKSVQFTNDAIAGDDYHLRLPSEEIHHELRGVAKTGDYYGLSDFVNILAAATDVPYSKWDNNPPPGSPEKRVIEQLRLLYYKDDLTGSLPLHQLEPRALPFETYQLAYTPDVLTDIFGGKATSAMMNEGKFLHSNGDANWWVRSGTIQYKSSSETVADAAARFFMPVSYTDPFGAVTTVTYLANYSFLASTQDALGNTISVDQFNYRTLTADRMRDINDNLSEVLVDELGLVKATAVLGKGAEADDLTGLTDYTTPAESTSIAAFFASPSSSALTAAGKTLLNHASTRFVYDLDAFYTSGQPVVAASIVREEYYKLKSNSPVQISFEYSSGTAQVIMKKAQAEPGLAKQLTIASDNSLTVTEVDTTPELRWVCTGRTIVNNKGNPVKQYQPYFSVTFQYEDDEQLVESGVTPLFYYDALGREIRTELPDGTFSKTTFTAWQHASYDPGDTVKDSQWYIDRVNSLIDAELIAEGKDPLKEKLAAIASETYYDTPSVQHFDALGRPILEVQHNRVSGGPDEFYYSSATVDIEGNLRGVTDARNNDVFTYKYDMLGKCVYQNGMDSGQRWMLANVNGANLYMWDERNFVFHYEYDILSRPTQTHVNGGDGDAPLDNIYERIFYGETVANAKASNLRGKAVRFYDTGGLTETDAYDFKGQPLTNNRQLFADYKGVPNWIDTNLAPDLEPDIFTSSTTRDALGRTTQNTAPDGSIETTTYNPAGLMETKTVQQGTTHDTIVQNIDYNEKGQRVRLELGNGVVTTYGYDIKTFNLLHVTTKTASNDTLQDLGYTFDATGNVTHIADDAVPLQFFNNQIITGLSTYTYDAIYRLVQVTGRENNAALSFGPEDNWNDQSYSYELGAGDPASTRVYTQSYAYDPTGNITQMKHLASGNNWTRDYTYQAANNRLATTTVGAQTYTYTHHPKHGFIMEMPHLDVLSWNFREKLVRTIRQKAVSGTPETTYYQYGADGERLRKITELAAAKNETPAKKDERIYLGNYERYTKYSNPDAGLVRHSLSIADGTGRIALIETRNDVDDGTDPRVVRYQLSNHLSSVNLEVDETARIISYEEYHPFGTTAYQVMNKAVKAAAKRYRYVGKERDLETGLEYHSARYYIPWLGRWLSTDPTGIKDGLNVYQYARNNPNSLRDVNGNESDEQKASKMFEEFLTQQGVNFKKEVPFRVEVNGKWVEGRADFFVEKSPNVWEPVEMKGKASSPWTTAQKEYLPALQSGAKFETIGTSKFPTKVTGSGGGKVMNVHTVAAGQEDFKKLVTSTVIKRPGGDPARGEKVTTVRDREGNIVSQTVAPDTHVGTRTSDFKPPVNEHVTPSVHEPHITEPHISEPHAGGKGLIIGGIIAIGILLYTGDSYAAAQSVNPAANTTDSIKNKESGGEVALSVAKDAFSYTPPGAIIMTGVDLNRMAMNASHFPVPPGFVEQKVAEGRNPFCALCHGEGGALDPNNAWNRKKEFDKLRDFKFPDDKPEDQTKLIEYLQSLQKQ